MYVLGHGEQNPQYFERDLLWQDEGYRERFEVRSTCVGPEADSEFDERADDASWQTAGGLMAHDLRLISHTVMLITFSSSYSPHTVLHSICPNAFLC